MGPSFSTGSLRDGRWRLRNRRWFRRRLDHILRGGICAFRQIVARAAKEIPNKEFVPFIDIANVFYAVQKGSPGRKWLICSRRINFSRRNVISIFFSKFVSTCGYTRGGVLRVPCPHTSIPDGMYCRAMPRQPRVGPMPAIQASKVRNELQTATLRWPYTLTPITSARTDCRVGRGTFEMYAKTIMLLVMYI